jgi:hypothetical protein
MADAVIGTCKLCLRAGQPLQESHLMPAGMYRRIRSTHKNPHPILFTKNSSRPSSRQVKDYVLCKQCESRFDSLGENYALRVAAQKARFRILEELESAPPSLVNSEWRGFAVVTTPGIKRDHLAYFALSVFWRASVHRWPSLSTRGRAPGIELGSENNEALRRYLLGESVVPSTMSLFFVVLTDALSRSAMNLPVFSHKKAFCWSYGFLACGLQFLLSVGRRLQREQINTCLMNSPQKWIWVRDGEAKTLEALRSLKGTDPRE